ncbi:2913_t:CDS:2 [Funneliformis geosporum]|nr:2913_t:CDS:2 [Funneliformis geosporum]
MIRGGYNMRKICYFEEDTHCLIPLKEAKDEEYSCQDPIHLKIFETFI